MQHILRRGGPDATQPLPDSESTDSRTGQRATLSQVGTWEWDFASGAVTWSDGLYRLLGMQPGSVLASYDLFVSSVHPEDRPSHEAAGRALMVAGGTVDHEFRTIRCDGAVRWMANKGEVFNDQAGKPSWAAGALFDITEIREAQHELAAREERYRALARVNAIGEWRATSSGQVIEAEFWMDFTGQSEIECLGNGWLSAVHPEDRESVSGLWSEALKLACTVEFTYRARHRSGEYRWVRTKAVPLKNSDDTTREWVGSDEDITDNRAAEENLRINENRLRLALEAARTMTWDYDFAASFVTRSPNAPEISGFGSGPLEDFLSRIQPEDSLRLRDALRRTIERGERYEVEYRVLDRSGRTKWLHARGELLRNAHEPPHRMIGVTSDVTLEQEANLHQRWMQEELDELNARINTFGSLVGGFVWTANANGKVKDVPAWRDFTGQAVEEIQGWGWLNALHPADRERTRGVMQRLMDTHLGETVEYRVRSVTGEYRWFRSRGGPVARRDGSISGWVGICKPLRGVTLANEQANPSHLVMADEPQLISGAQVRAARGIVNWSVRDLAEASAVSISTIRRIEDDVGLPETRDLRKLDLIRRTLEAAGVDFVPAVNGKGGVRPS
jgi:PAS domain S-box-containing protein